MGKIHTINGKTFIVSNLKQFNASKKSKPTNNTTFEEKYLFFKKPKNAREPARQHPGENIHKTMENPSFLPLGSPSYYPNINIIYRDLNTSFLKSRKASLYFDYEKTYAKCKHNAREHLFEQKIALSGKNEKKKDSKSKKEKAKKDSIINDTKLSRNLAKRKKKLDAEKKKRRRKKTEYDYAIDYSKLDSKGDPSVSFVVKSPRREELLAILNAKVKGIGAKKEDKAARIRTVRKLGKEFARIYARYRNMLLKSKGSSSRFMMPPNSEKYCQNAALQCIYNEITPRQLLEYWDEHITDFANGSFTKPYPPLSFLSSNFASEQVAMALFEETNGGTKKWSSGDFNKNKKSDTHSFFDTEQLDKRLRDGLLGAGFELGGKYDNRYLITVQKTAMAISNGKKIFVAGKLKQLVDWAVDNLYGVDNE